MKKMFKRCFVLMLAVLMIFSVTACGGKTKVREKQKMSDADKDAIYEYETVAWSDEVKENIGSTQYAGGVLYANLYEFDEETYETTNYFVTYDLDGNELSRFELKAGYDDNTSYGISWFAMSDNQEIYAVKYEYFNGLNEATGEWEWSESYYLVRFDEQGNELWSVPLGSSGSEALNGGGEYFYVNNLMCDKNGNVWVFDSYTVTSFDKEGNKGIVIEMGDNLTGTYWFNDEGNLVVGQWNDDWTSVDYLVADTKTGKLSDEGLEVPGGYYSYTYYSGEGTQWDMLATNGIGVWGFNWGDKEMTKVMDFILSDFGGTGLYNLQVLEDGKFIANYYDAEDWTSQTGIFTKVPKEQVADKYLINLACYYVDTDVRKAVLDFNRSHDDVRIVVTDYSSLDSEENEWTLGMETLNGDLLSGKVPDILIVPSDFDMGMYVNKGLFTDLYALMEQDTTINLDDYLSNIIELGEYDGKLYELIPKFSAVTLAGRASEVGDGFSISYEDANALLASKGDGVKLFEMGSTRYTVMNYGVNLAFDQFYDGNLGECYFNTPEFEQFLEMISEYPEMGDEESWTEDYWSQYESQWRNGRTILKYSWVYDFKDYTQLSQGYFGEKVSYVGFPTTGESGSAASVDFTLAISEESPFKTEAWEFISSFIRSDYQENIESGFPVSLDALQKKAEKDMEPDIWYDPETGEAMSEGTSFWVGDEEILISAPTEEECQYVMEFLKNIDYRQKYLSDITAIIEEDAASYFAGEKTAKQVADTIQSRVKIFVNEKR